MTLARGVNKLPVCTTMMTRFPSCRRFTNSLVRAFPMTRPTFPKVSAESIVLSDAEIL